MLSGAASMIPGGVGTTEVAIVAPLSTFVVPLDVATLSAIGICIASLWFSVFCGFLSLFSLEFKFIK